MAIPLPMQHLDGIARIAGQYDGFVLDVWGVLHDGRQPYPGAVDALERLRAAGRPFVLLSNAPARTEAVVDRILRVGFPRDLIGAVVSSGEEVWRHLHERRDPAYAALGRRCLLLAEGLGGRMIEGLDLEIVDRIAAAEFILNTGPSVEDEAATRLLPLLREGAQRSLPMVCANPDLVVMYGTTRIVCAGQVAKIYEGLGGPVLWHGKPYPSVYRTCLERLGIADRSRVLAVGDSLRTDIAGAAASGLDSLLIAGGIHAEEFGLVQGAPIDVARVEAGLGTGPRPTYLARHFAW